MRSSIPAHPEGNPLRPARHRPGRRRRRLRRVLALLVIVVGGASMLWLVRRASRAPARRPGESMPEITERLSRSLPPEAPQPRLTDVTREAGLAGFRTFAGERSSQLPEDMGSGAAWGDFDNDGDDDLFVVAAGGRLGEPDSWLPSQLFENLGDGTFRAVDDFPAPRIVGMAAAWGDADGDGWLDLVVTGYQALRLFRNHQGHLVRDDTFPDPPGYWAGAAWVDYDGDRDLDLYVCGYVDYREGSGGPGRVTQQYGAAVPFTLNPATYEPLPNLLFENHGDGSFEEVAALLGVSNPGGRSLSALWHDFDADGRPDLYVANDISDNALFLNRGTTFEDAGLAAWVADYRGAMGLAAGDWDRDGDDDLFITHWIAQENALYDSRLAQAPEQAAQRLTFSDMAAPLRLGQIALQSVGWGTEFVDLDADGWLDLVIANGSTLETAEQPKRLEPQPAMLLWNDAGRYFHDLAPLVPALAEPRVSRGLAVSDYDLDGDPDLLLVQLDGGVRLLRNDMRTGNWLEIRLRNRLSTGPSAATAAFGRGDGASVRVRVGSSTLRRAATGASYLSQSSRTLHFGLGPADRIDGVEVVWPTGESQSWGSLEANALWELTEGETEPRRLQPKAAAAPPAAATAGETDRQTTLRFWELQRAAMHAMRVAGDPATAEGLFRQALEIDPLHQDSRYYLANALAELGRTDEALAELDRMRRDHPGSHRAHKQWAVLRSLTARDQADLVAAEAAAQRALEINTEETGSLQLLGEIALLRGDLALAAERLSLVCRTNPKAAGAFFLRGYLRWRDGDEQGATDLLQATRAALGPDWKPRGAAAEGDVARRMHTEQTPLMEFLEAWDGGDRPARAYEALSAHLEALYRQLDAEAGRPSG